MTIDLTDPRLMLDPGVLDDPRAFYDTLRREAPIWQIPGQDTFLVSDPALIREAVGRIDDFSSNLVKVLHDDGSRKLIPFPIARYGDPVHVLSTADPPLHDHHRKILQTHVSPASMAGLEPAITDIVDEHLSAVLPSGRFDAVATFSDPVPARTICEVVGLPASDAGTVLRFANGTGALLDGITDVDGMRLAATSGLELTIFVHERLEEALALPPEERSGLLSILAGSIDDGLVDVGEVRDMMVVLVTAGSETTASLIATMIETLARDPERQAALRKDPELIPAAIEEILRADGPFQFHYRYVPAATTLGGVDIPAKSQVLLMWAAANRPGGETPAPTTHPHGSKPAPHFAFGRGLHFCLGAPLARLEARIAIDRLLQATSSFTLDEEHPPTRRPSIFIRRHATLPIIVEGP